MKIPTVKELAEVGFHFGHREGRWHPSMKPYIYGSQKGVHIIDLGKARKKLKEALEYIKSQAALKKTLLLVGTKIRVGELVKKAGQEVKMPYIDLKWLGGMLTNFKTFQENIKKLKSLEEKKKKGELEHYTKRERYEIDQEIKELNQIYGGIKELKKLPDLMIVLDARVDHLAVKEAQKLGIPLVVLADTNIDVSQIDFPIPGNDDAIKAVGLVLELIGQAYQEGREESLTEKKKKEKKK